MFLKIENWTSDFTSNRSKLKLNSFDCFEKRRKNYTHGKARKQVVKRLTIGHRILRQTGANWIHLKISEEKTTLTRKHANKRSRGWKTTEKTTRFQWRQTSASGLWACWDAGPACCWLVWYCQYYTGWRKQGTVYGAAHLWVVSHQRSLRTNIGQ